jgi:hypothetical protein
VNKQLSPMFAVIVIIAAVVLGALYFMTRYRAHEAAFQAESKALQQQADNARRMGRGMMGGNRPGRGMRRGMTGPGAPTQGREGAAPGGERRAGERRGR